MNSTKSSDAHRSLQFRVLPGVSHLGKTAPTESTDMHMLKDGQIFCATNEAEHVLGERAFAEVYRARQRSRGRQAVKEFRRSENDLAANFLSPHKQRATGPET